MKPKKKAGGRRLKIFLWTTLALAMLTTTLYVAGEWGGTIAAEAERARDLEEVRRLRERARARGEPVFLEEFITKSTPEALAVGERLETLRKRRSDRASSRNETDKAIDRFFLYGVPVEEYRAQLAALPHPPLEYIADDFADIDRILEGPRPAHFFHAEEMHPYRENFSYAHTLRQAATLAIERAKIVAVQENGDAGLAELIKAFVLADSKEGDPGRLGFLFYNSARLDLCAGAGDIALLDPPSPAALRRVAALVEAWPSLEASARHTLVFERAIFERHFFLDADWNQKTPTDNMDTRISYAAGFPAGVLSELSDDEYTELLEHIMRSAPAFRPGRNIRTMYREFDQILSHPDFFSADHLAGFQPRAEAARQSLSRMETVPSWARKPWVFTAILRRMGAGDPDCAILAYQYIGYIPKVLHWMVGELAYRKAFTYAMRLYADRLEGKPYPSSGAPQNPRTGRPFEMKREGGFCLILTSAYPGDPNHYNFRLPLFPDDEGYDPEHAWRFGHEPAASPEAED